MKITTRELSAEKDDIPGFIAHPERAERGSGLLIVHHHYGVTGHLKSVACNFAQLGYTTIVPDLYLLLGFSDHNDIQKKTTDGQFVQVIDQGWRYLLRRNEVDRARVGVVGYCMGGRIGIHFVAATPAVRAFIGYYPSVREEPPSNLRPRHPNDAVREFKCPSLIFYGGQDRVAPVHVQERLWASFLQSGQPLEWHFFYHAGHGFALTDGDGYDPNLASLTWPLTVDFLARELDNY
ncbi:MAG: dienelactone hydrolase family protein [Deltaproteobacteria bacterium]|nr:dienelactone hydrolase family protein [Deltaproteobacteria bacterium]